MTADKPIGTEKKISSRFEKIAKDPRFIRIKKKHSLLKVDKRFESMFSDSTFTTPYKVDRYGRNVGKNKKESVKKELESFYQLEKSESEENLKDSELSEMESSEEEDSQSDLENDNDKDKDDDILERAYAQHPLVNNDVVLGDATNRLAIVNVDWDQIRFNGFQTNLRIDHFC
jgi:hypothetical protein